MNTTADSLVKLAARVDAIQPFYVMELMKEAQQLESAGRDVIHMGIGEPDFTAPEPVVEAAAAALRRGVTQYTSALGLAPLREAIAAHYARAYGLTIAPERIVVTAGASAALLLACLALVGRDDEVLMPDPSYPCNRHFVAAAEGRPVLVPSGSEARFQLTADDVRTRWNERTRGVLLASPSNPTGTSLEPDELKRIVEAVRARGGFTIVDEIYQGLSYDAPPVSALSFGDDVVTVNSFSKYFSMTGWRLGWLVVPPALVGTFEKLSQNLFICPSALAQHAALACFEPASLDIYEARRLEFKRRRDFIAPALERLGFTVPVMPDGAFYVYAHCGGVAHPAAGDSAALTHAMLHDAGVVLVPGMDFGVHAPHDYIRLSYATAYSRLEEAVDRLATLFGQR
ncbi:TPA: pyridoxal phosphate-dependent aminotransferase [Burkholderia multivorans]|uniref:pyridoxal phosphate-dependent aminotransferase n=1 Tax=Burkholderia multivorans TaxID=87883 RepID=UPI000CFF34B0|nr:pyridoxal phosphate-dependent aminotransferase [Burkholderia multivorans]MBU9305510.1 pyridoxal phosphate-dependent aminotransferase [Burkholderia multivorans]MBU9408277.1 pyridoxal phosphate-dependent aminotransferase [Burkholderia multivorans]MBU9507603.1 pyridoxal phosphate-dependent aminotransferase [Burkholderia multivorans]MCA8462397.1 pyridoxal phosphate-dependent aminotransferase [Burkholderia multivorans]MDN8017320.1 pyridoxal phosphate-dependent aminotransferase [Burkholderia mult